MSRASIHLSTLHFESINLPFKPLSQVFDLFLEGNTFVGTESLSHD